MITSELQENIKSFDRVPHNNIEGYDIEDLKGKVRL